MWEINRTNEIAEWIDNLDEDTKEAIFRALLILREIGPTLGRPYVDTLKSSKYKNLKELRIQIKRKVLRILFIFNVQRKIVLLVGGDKKGDKRYYKRMIPIAEKLYEKYLKQWSNENDD